MIVAVLPHQTWKLRDFLINESKPIQMMETNLFNVIDKIVMWYQEDCKTSTSDCHLTEFNFKDTGNILVIGSEIGLQRYFNIGD